MALVISDACINCDVCAPACPNEAITQGVEIYEIDPARCTQCVGHFDVPQCQMLCPVDCIALDPQWNETDELLREKYLKILNHREHREKPQGLTAKIRGYEEK